MEFKVRKVTKANGGVDFRICLSLSADEAINAPRIADDDNVNLDFHRMKGDVSQRADWVLCWARILAFWAHMWGERESHMPVIAHGMQLRKRRKRKSRKRK
jgi:hypothetical protein